MTKTHQIILTLQTLGGIILLAAQIYWPNFSGTLFVTIVLFELACLGLIILTSKI